MTRYPHRIVCLTEETTETLYLLGQGDRVVGVSGYTVRPPEARQKPKVSAFFRAGYGPSSRSGAIRSFPAFAGRMNSSRSRALTRSSVNSVTAVSPKIGSSIPRRWPDATLK